MGNLISNIIPELSQMDPISMEDLIVRGAEWKVLSRNIGILRSMSGIASVIFSSLLIWMITRSHKGLSTTQHRLLLGLSICDLISSFGYSTFNIMAPSDVKYRIWNARGSIGTCDAQGFLIIFGIAGGLFYNATLNVYYVAVVNYGKSEDYIRTKMEPFLHGVPIVVGLTYSIVGLVHNHFNENGSGICIRPIHYPPHCQGYDVGDVRDGFEIPCGRGSEGGDRIGIFGAACMFIPAIIITVSLVAIYRAVKKQEKKLSNYTYGAVNMNALKNNPTKPPSLWTRIKKMSLDRQSSSPSTTNAHPAIRSNNMQSQSRAIMHRAFQYSAAWFLSWGTFTLNIFTGRQIVLVYVMTMFVPLQGFFNFCIYMYPKVVSARKPKRGQDKKVSWCQAIKTAFWSRGKDTRKRNHPRPARTSNLLREGRNNRPLRTNKENSTKNGNGNDNDNDNDNARRIRTPQCHSFRDNHKTTNKDIETHYKYVYRRDPQEEEEKCEIQPPSNMLVSDRHKKVSQLTYTYAPNLTHHGGIGISAATHPVNDSPVKDVGEVAGSSSEASGSDEVAASEASGNDEVDGKGEYLARSDINISKQDESIIIDEDVVSEGHDVQFTITDDYETEMK